MNNISIMGRLTSNPECKETENGNKVLNFSIAVKRPYSKETTDFIRCVAWKGTAEFIEKWFSKGKMIALTGILTSRTWKDDNGNNHSVMEVLVDKVEFCGDKSGNDKDNAPEIPEGLEEIEEELPF